MYYPELYGVGASIACVFHINERQLKENQYVFDEQYAWDHVWCCRFGQQSYGAQEGCIVTFTLFSLIQFSFIYKVANHNNTHLKGLYIVR